MKDSISLLILVSLSMLISCGEKKQKGSEVVHPVQESIPHSDIASDQLGARNAAYFISDLPVNVQLLYKFLNNETTQFNTVKLNILTTDRIDISTLGDSGFLILEK